MPEPLLCPSANCEPNAILLGIISENGTVEFLEQKVLITQAFVDLAEQQSPEARFRFASPCKKGACGQWANQRCGVIDNVMQLLPLELENFEVLPTCTIREQCRWFEQIGKNACVACPLVITDSRVSPDFI